MRALLLILAWITPALVAGMLGWKNTWGGTGSPADYLIPIPLAIGVFHVPSFAIAAIFILNLHKASVTQARFVLLAAFGVFLVALTLQLEFDRLNAWLFTDYAPSGSPIRFRGNPLALFIASDALWVALYAWTMNQSTPWKHALLLPLVPVAVIGFAAAAYTFSGPQFRYGFSAPGKTRGNAITMIHTSNAYDEKLFRTWLEGRKGSVIMPWDSVNDQHLAVLFTRSMQAIKWRKTDDVKDVVATLCFYEEDRSSTAHAGYFDCFAGHSTLSQDLEASYEATKTGFGKDLDRWFASAKLCKGVEIPERFVSDVERVNLCRGVKARYPQLLRRLAQQHGADSAQVEFLKSNAGLIGIASTP